MAKKKKSIPKNKKQKTKEPVTLVADPYQLQSVLDLEFQDEEESKQQLSEIADALSQNEEKEVKEATEYIQDSQNNSDQELQKQIQEDLELQELEKKMQQELEEGKEETEQALPSVNENGDLDQKELQSCIETLLFLSDKPLALKKMKELLGPTFPVQAFKKAVQALQEEYQQTQHGIEIVSVSGGFQFRTKPGRAALARKLVKAQPHRLSRGAMETLAIIAYKQPSLKEDIDKVRGVDCSHFIRNLLEKQLIQISGRSDLPGRPMVYSTTPEFLEIFGLENLSALPPLQELEKMVPESESENEEEDKNLRKMRDLLHELSEKKHEVHYDAKEDEKIISEIKENIKSISTSTPYIDEQKRMEKEAAQSQPSE